MEAEEMVLKITEWLVKQKEEAAAQGFVLGISGGLDSAVVAALAHKAAPGKVLGVIMPCHSLTQDIEHAGMVVDWLGIESKVVDLSDLYDMFISRLVPAGDKPHPLAAANVKPRLRMITLYYLAQERGYLVLGTGNRTELTVGYFTKHGDGGVDLLPIGGLVKAQVRELARYLGVPKVIIDKAPSAGLWEGQTDEKEIGLTYAEMDRYILTGEGTDFVRKRVEEMRRASQHKRRTPPIPHLG